MSRMTETFVVKEGPEAALSAQDRKAALRMMEAAFSNAAYSLLQGDKAAAASRLRKLATDLDLHLQRMAQEVLR